MHETMSYCGSVRDKALCLLIVHIQRIRRRKPDAQYDPNKTNVAQAFELKEGSSILTVKT